MKPHLVAELLPRGRRAYLTLAIVGVGCVVLFGVLHVLGHTYLGRFTTNGSVEAFDLDSEGSLATWFNAMLLFLCGQVTLLLWYALDPAGERPEGARGANGRLRGGLLASSIVWFAMSADEGGSLHEGFKELAVMLLGTRLHGDGSIYWIVPYFVVLAATGVFLLRRMGRTPAGGLLMAAGGLWALAVVNQLELLFAQPLISILVEESCETLGSLCLLASLCLFAHDAVRAGGRGD